MTNLSTKYKTNWRQISTHLFATILFILAARQLAMLNDLEIINAIDKYGYPEALKYLAAKGEIVQRLSHFTLWNNLAVLIALITTFII